MSEARVQNERLNRANAILTNDVPKPAPGAKERVWRGVERHRRPWRMRLGWPEAVVFAAALGVVFFVRRADAPAPQVAWRSVPTGGAVSAHGATIRSLGASTVRTPPVEAGRTIVQVVDGHLAFDVAARGAGETFEVQTRHAIVTVVGTRFAVRADDDGTVVEVEEGIVEVSARSGTTRRLRAGERIRIASAAALAGHAGAAPSSGRSPDRREGREGLDVVAADARASDGRGPGDGAGADGHHDARTPTEAKASGDRIAANGAAADEDIPEASTAVKGAAANGASGRGAAANAAAWNGATRNRGATVGAAANGAAVKSASGRGAAANAAAPDGATGNRGAAANGAAVKSASGRGAAANAAAVSAAAANGASRRGAAANARAPSGAVSNGPTVNGATVNGATVNGATVNGATVNGATVNGATVNGATVNGATVNGATVNGATVNGATVNGATVNGATVNGAAVNGAAANGAAANDAAASGAAANGAVASGSRAKLGARPGAPSPEERLRIARKVVASDASRAAELASSVLDEAPAPSLEAEALAVLADARRRAGDAAQAAELYRALANHPAGAAYGEEALLQLALVSRDVGRLDDARRALELAAERYRDGPLALERAALGARLALADGAPNRAATILLAAPNDGLSLELIRTRLDVAEALLEAEPKLARRLLNVDTSRWPAGFADRAEDLKGRLSR